MFAGVGDVAERPEKGGDAAPVDVRVLPLDRIFPHGFGHVRVLKLDTQGFECRILKGAYRVLRHPQSRVDAIAVEVARKLLNQQCCRPPAMLMHLMRAIGEPTVGRGQWLGPALPPPGGFAAGLYQDPQRPRPTGAAQPSPTPHVAWNVSCDRSPYSSADEKTCVARPVGAGPPRAYKLPFEAYEPPLPLAKLVGMQREMSWCEERKTKRLQAKA